MPFVIHMTNRSFFPKHSGRSLWCLYRHNQQVHDIIWFVLQKGRGAGVLQLEGILQLGLLQCVCVCVCVGWMGTFSYTHLKIPTL